MSNAESYEYDPRVEGVSSVISNREPVVPTSPPQELEGRERFKVGDEIWVRDKVRSTAKSEPSVLPENGIWRDSRDVQLMELAMPRGIQTLSHSAVCLLSRIFNAHRNECTDGQHWEINGALKEEIEFAKARK